MNWRVHYIPYLALSGPDRTACGMSGFRNWASDEYDAVSGGRFEAKGTWQGVTCKRCLRAKERTEP